MRIAGRQPNFCQTDSSRERAGVSKVPQNSAFAAKFDQAVAANTFLWRQIPIKGFEAIPSLPDATPPLFRALSFHVAHEEDRSGISLPERFEISELLVELHACGREHKFGICPNRAVTP
jgi:hypothetical protein